MAPWGTYLLFAIVATVVIVLLLDEALGQEHNDARSRDQRSRKANKKNTSTKAPSVPKDNRDGVEAAASHLDVR